MTYLYVYAMNDLFFSTLDATSTRAFRHTTQALPLSFCGFHFLASTEHIQGELVIEISTSLH